jgi:uroporphyrinogen-III synthase
MESSATSPDPERTDRTASDSGAVEGASQESLAALRVVALESRMSDQTATLIERSGGIAVRAPSMRELPLEDNAVALEFAQRLMADDLDIVIFLTGVGTKHLAEAIETRHAADEWRAALARTVVVSRGPKPQAVLRGWRVRIDVQVPEPNTWRDLLRSMDEACEIAGKRVAIQEYGEANAELIEGLKSRGAAEVFRVPVYRWALPEDLEPLKAAVHAMIEGTVGALVVTSAQQVRHLMQIARDLGMADRLVAAIDQQIVLASVGPVATETLAEYGLKPDVVPDHPKLVPLVKALAAGWKASRKSVSVRSFGPLSKSP